METATGALVLDDPSLDQIALIMALRSKCAGLTCSDGTHFTHKRNDWLTWDMSHERPTLFRSYDKCLKCCRRLNKGLESDKPQWRPMIWVSGTITAESVRELLQQYLHHWQLVTAGSDGQDEDRLEEVPT